MYLFVIHFFSIYNRLLLLLLLILKLFSNRKVPGKRAVLESGDKVGASINIVFKADAVVTPKMVKDRIETAAQCADCVLKESSFTCKSYEIYKDALFFKPLHIFVTSMNNYSRLLGSNYVSFTYNSFYFALEKMASFH